MFTLSDKANHGLTKIIIVPPDIKAYM